MVYLDVFLSYRVHRQTDRQRENIKKSTSLLYIFIIHFKTFRRPCEHHTRTINPKHMNVCSFEKSITLKCLRITNYEVT